MRRFFLAGLVGTLFLAKAWAETATSFEFDPFGPVKIYKKSERPTNVIILVSGDGGWNQAMADMAEAFSNLDAVVAGVDINNYFQRTSSSTEACAYPAADFEALSQYLQKTLDYPDYTLPVLIGHSSGATLVYAVLAQAPPGTFQGGVSLAFCPDLKISKPLCRGSGLEAKEWPQAGGYDLLPTAHLETSWVVLQGLKDETCDVQAVPAFVKQVEPAELLTFPTVGHGFSVQASWMPQFKEAFTHLIAEKRDAGPLPPDQVKGLPVVPIRAKTDDNKSLAVIISGDGGWANIDRQLGKALSKQGVSVVGLNSLRYFWHRRTPEQASDDLERLIRFYLAAWHKEDVILIGYSRGADVLPFMINRLPPEIKYKIASVHLLGLESKVEFEIHVSALWNKQKKKNLLDVKPEVEELKGMKVVCYYGAKEKDTLCTEISLPLLETVMLGGGHHFGGNYRQIADKILENNK